MQSSSLIFVVVVAIWAAYLVQYWVRRRDHLATIRSVDRFSAAMRVLDAHRLSQTEQPARSYVVSPARAARPEVVVKRGAPEARQPASVGRLDRTASSATRPTPASSRPGAVAAVVDAPRKVRGLALLTHLVLLPLTLLLAAVGPLPWLVPGLLLIGLVASFGWLRQDVRAEQARRSAQRGHARRAATARPSSVGDAEGVDRVHPVEDRAAVRAAEARPAPQHRDAAAEADEVAPDSPFDVEDRAGEQVPPSPSADDHKAGNDPAEDGTWEPVPVPRPTYTMKAKAPARPVVEEPASAPASGDAPQALPAIDDDVDDVVAPRAITG